MAYEISLTKRTNGGYTVVADGETWYSSELKYHGTDGGVILYDGRLNLQRYYLPDEWTIQTVSGYTTVVDVCDALDALGVLASDTLEDMEALLTTIDADTSAIKVAVQLMDDDLDDARIALQVIDDWDESDRAKVNLIASQAGIDGNAGAVTAKTPRVTLASDDPAVVSLGNIDNAVDGSYLNVNINAAGTDVATNSGTLNDQTLRVAIATDDVNAVKIVNATELIDDTVATLGTTTYAEATTKGLVIAAIRRDADTSMVDTTNEAAPLQVNALGRLKTEDTNTSAIKTAVESLDNAVDGNYLNTNLNIAGTDVDGNSGNKSAQTLRVVIATDQPALTNKLLVTEDSASAIKTAVESLDNAVDGNYLNVNANIAGTDIVGGAGAVTAGVQRVTLASDDPAVVAVQLIDDTVKTLGTDTYAEATTKGLVIGAVRTDAETALANTTNEITPLSISAAGRLKVESQGRITAPAILVAAASAQNVTTSWVDLGNEITTGGANMLALWVVVTHTNSVNVRVRILGKHTSSTGAEFLIPIKTVATTDVKVNAHYYELDTDATQNILLDWDVTAVPYVQVQIQCETVGATADTVSSDYTLMY